MFACAEVGGRQFFGLKAQPFFVAAPFFGGFAQGGELPFQLRHLRVFGAVLFEQSAVSGHGVEGRNPEILGRKNQILVLRMDVDEPCAQFAQLRQLHGQVVDERTAFARRGQYAREDGLRRVVEVVFLEKGFQPEPVEVESALHHAVARRILDGRKVAAGAQQQPQRTQQDGFSGARLARDDVQPGVGLQNERVDQRVVFDRETA